MSKHYYDDGDYDFDFHTMDQDEEFFGDMDDDFEDFDSDDEDMDDEFLLSLLDLEGDEAALLRLLDQIAEDTAR